jgi:hypothetical protein
MTANTQPNHSSNYLFCVRELACAGFKTAETYTGTNQVKQKLADTLTVK